MQKCGESLSVKTFLLHFGRVKTETFGNKLDWISSALTTKGYSNTNSTLPQLLTLLSLLVATNQLQSQQSISVYISTHMTSVCV